MSGGHGPRLAFRPFAHFSPRRFRAILFKEFRHIVRDTRTLLLVTLAPAFLLLLLANIFAVESQEARFAVWDLDRSPYARRYLEALTADQDFTLEATLNSGEEIEPLLLAGRVDFVLVIPEGFGRALTIGQNAPVQAVFDATDAIRVPQVLGDLSLRSAAFSKAVLLEGRYLGSQPLELRSAVWYNPQRRAMVGMVPGLTSVVLSMPALAYGLALARERELGSFEGLITTPVQGTEYLLGKALGYVTLGMGSVFMAWLVAILWFQVPFRGSFPLYLLLSALYLSATIGLVTALSPILRTQQLAFFTVLTIFFIPAFFNAGLLVPVLDTGWERISSDIFPATHFVEIARGIFVKALGVGELLRPIGILAFMATAGLLIAVTTFKKRLT